MSSSSSGRTSAVLPSSGEQQQLQTDVFKSKIVTDLVRGLWFCVPSGKLVEELSAHKT